MSFGDKASSIKLEYEPIQVIPLSPDGLLPTSGAAGEASQKLNDYRYRYRPPQNDLEKTLMSVWVNTHQAMFISTGIAASCVGRLSRLVAARDLGPDRFGWWIDTAVACRLASAAYTSLPPLTLDRYESYIRKSMMAVHPGFSGVSNREAISMETCLRQLKSAQKQLASAHPSLAADIESQLERVYEAERIWWRAHGKAMSKYVTDPTSLARMDYLRQKQEGGGDGDFTEYRRRVLRDPNALDDYDRYFGVTRSEPVSAADYIALLDNVMRRSAPYVEQSGALAEYRERGLDALRGAIDALIATASD